MINSKQSSMTSIRSIASAIEKHMSTKKVDCERTFNSDEVIEWTVTTEDMCKCDITLIEHDDNSIGIEIRPYVLSQYGEPIYFPNRMHVDKTEAVLTWFKQQFVYELYYVKSFRKITQNIHNVAKQAGFEGICLSSKVNHGTDDRGCEFISESFELESVFNNIKKKIETTVNAYKGKIFISTRSDGDWETISKDKDARRALGKFKNRIEKYLAQYDPNPRYYLMLLQDSQAFGEKIKVFPVNNTKMADEYK